MSESKTSLQSRLSSVKYPANYGFDVDTLAPYGALLTRYHYWQRHCPELLACAQSFLSVGCATGYLLFVQETMGCQRCYGVEPNRELYELAVAIRDYRKSGVQLACMTLRQFLENHNVRVHFIWVGNVFKYVYQDAGWQAIKTLAETVCSNGVVAVEDLLSGEELIRDSRAQGHVINETLVADLSFTNFVKYAGEYFDVVRYGPSGTEPRRVIVVLRRNGKAEDRAGVAS